MNALVPLWRRAVVEARIKLVEPNLTEAQRRYLWESIGSRELLIKLIATGANENSVIVDGIHYVKLRDDFSDLDEKIEYFDRNEDEAMTIVTNANQFMKQFEDQRRERVISILVLQKYFENTGQLPSEPVLQLRP